MAAPEKTRRMVLTFSQGNKQYGVYARYVREIMALPALTRVPGDCDALLGLFLYKGSVVPVVSFARLCRQQADETTCLVLQEGGVIVGLSVAHADDLVPEGETKLAYEQDEMNRGVVKIDSIIQNGGAIMIIDIANTFNAELFKAGRGL